MATKEPAERLRPIFDSSLDGLSRGVRASGRNRRSPPSNPTWGQARPWPVEVAGLRAGAYEIDDSERLGQVGELTNRQVVERYMKAFPTDFAALGELRHPDYVEDWPQSGERIHGHDNYVRIHQQYPGGLPEAATQRIVGSEDRWATSPSYTLVRINGAGDTYTVEGALKYPTGHAVYLVAILELREGRVAKVTHYFADPFEAPDWRAQWVEPIPGS